MPPGGSFKDYPTIPSPLVLPASSMLPPLVLPASNMFPPLALPTPNMFPHLVLQALSIFPPHFLPVPRMPAKCPIKRSNFLLPYLPLFPLQLLQLPLKLLIHKLVSLAGTVDEDNKKYGSCFAFI